MEHRTRWKLLLTTAMHASKEVAADLIIFTVYIFVDIKDFLWQVKFFVLKRVIVLLRLRWTYRTRGTLLNHNARTQGGSSTLNYIDCLYL